MAPHFFAEVAHFLNSPASRIPTSSRKFLTRALSGISASSGALPTLKGALLGQTSPPRFYPFADRALTRARLTILRWCATLRCGQKALPRLTAVFPLHPIGSERPQRPRTFAPELTPPGSRPGPLIGAPAASKRNIHSALRAECDCVVSRPFGKAGSAPLYGFGHFLIFGSAHGHQLFPCRDPESLKR